MSEGLDAAVSKETAAEASEILDALSVLSHDIACDEALPAETLVLPAQKVREVCGAILHAVTALKRLLQLADAQAALRVPGDSPTEGGSPAD